MHLGYRIFCFVLILFFGTNSGVGQESGQPFEDSVLYNRFIEVRSKVFQNEPILPESLDSLIESAESQRDTVLLFKSLCLGYPVFMARGEDGLALEYISKGYEIAYAFGIPLTAPFQDSLTFYNWFMNEWREPIQILSEGPVELTIDDVSSKMYVDSFRPNLYLEFNPAPVYWIKTKLIGEKGQSYLLGFGSGVYSWDKIDVFIPNESSWTHLLSGVQQLASHKAVRDAFNHILYHCEKTKVEIYVRLEGANVDYSPNYISISHIDHERDIELFGYRFPGSYTIHHSAGYDYTVIQRSVEMIEASDSSDFQDVANNWDNYQPILKRFKPLEIDQDRWIRFHVIGTDAGSGDQLFQIGSVELSWPHIDGYYEFDKQLYQFQSGFEVPPKKKPIKHGANLISIPTRYADTTSVFMRLSGGSKNYIPDGIFLEHLDANSFWPVINSKYVWNTLLLGILIIQVAFFLIIAYIERDDIHAYYSLLLFSIGLFLITMDIWTWQKLLPTILEYRSILYLLSHFLIAFSLVKYSQRYLSISPHKVNWKSPFLLFLFGIAGMQGIEIIWLLQKQVTNVFDADHWIANGKTILFLLMMFYLMVLSIRQIRKKNAAAVFFLIAMTSFIVSGSFLLAVGLFDLDHFTALANKTFGVGLIITVILFSIGSGYRTRQLKLDREQALEYQLKAQEKLNKSLLEKNELKDRFIEASEKFIPQDFIHAIGRPDITEVKFGDRIETQATVLFADIRGYTTLAEKMTPEETYQFVIQMNRLFAPVIREHHGFVNDFLGDGLLAVFSRAPEHAIEAAIAMQESLRQMNLQNSQKGVFPIKIGIGIHTGPVILGIIGDQKRMSAATISDVVNTASRIEGLTKYFGVSVLISGATVTSLPRKNQYEFRDLGDVLVKGRDQPLQVFECIDAEEKEVQKAKKKILSHFTEGLSYFIGKELDQAKSSFATVLTQLPNDQPTINFMQRIQDIQDHGITDWSAVDIRTEK